MNNKHLTISASVVIALGFLSITLADAQLIDVNFTNGSDLYSGAAALGASGDEWNNLNSGAANFTSSSLILSTGDSTTSGAEPSGVTVTTSGFAGLTQGFGSFGNLAKPLFNDGLYSLPGPGVANPTLTFNGLAANTIYQLDLYSSNYSFDPTTPYGLGPYADREVDFTVNGVTALDTVAAAATFVDGVNYALLLGKTNGAGQLVITASPAPTLSGSEIDVMGVQIQALAAPEPSTWALMLAGMASLVGLQRFNRSRG